MIKSLEKLRRSVARVTQVLILSLFIFAGQCPFNQSWADGELVPIDQINPTDDTLSKSIDKPFFYVAEKDGKKTYFLGSMPWALLFRQFPEYVREAFYSSDQVVVAFKSPPRFLVLFTTASYFIQFFGSDLSKRLSPSEWNTLIELVKKQGFNFSPEELERWTPFLADMLIFLGSGTEDAMKNELEHELEKRAKKKHKTIVGLWNLRGFLRKMSRLMTLADLKAELNKNIAEHDERIAEFRRNYFSGDEKALLDSVQKLEEQDARLTSLKQIPFEHNWFSKLTRIHQKRGQRRGNTFVALNVVALLGEQGILALLQADGFKITRLTSAKAELGV